MRPPVRRRRQTEGLMSGALSIGSGIPTTSPLDGVLDGLGRVENDVDGLDERVLGQIVLCNMIVDDRFQDQSTGEMLMVLAIIAAGSFALTAACTRPATSITA